MLSTPGLWFTFQNLAFVSLTFHMTVIVQYMIVDWTDHSVMPHNLPPLTR